MSNPSSIRPIAICIIRRDDDILVFEAHDSIRGDTFYRPLGGAIEFEEYGIQAIKREIYEEINADITNMEFLGVLENIFTFNGRPGHEIVLVYQADFANPSFYRQETIMGEEDNGEKLKVLWKPIPEFASGKLILYPDGLIKLLSRSI